MVSMRYSQICDYDSQKHRPASRLACCSCGYSARCARWMSRYMHQRFAEVGQLQPVPACPKPLKLFLPHRPGARRGARSVLCVWQAGQVRAHLALDRLGQCHDRLLAAGVHLMQLDGAAPRRSARLCYLPHTKRYLVSTRQHRLVMKAAEQPFVSCGCPAQLVVCTHVMSSWVTRTHIGNIHGTQWSPLPCPPPCEPRG